MRTAGVVWLKISPVLGFDRKPRSIPPHGRACDGFGHRTSPAQGDHMPRCARCGTDPLYIDYHDREWGVPARDPQVLFEFLLLEAFQAGFLDHRTAQARALPAGAVRLRCRAPGAHERCRDRRAHAGSRHHPQPAQARGGAQQRACRLQLEHPVGFVWSFVGGEPKINRFERTDQVPAVSPEAEAMSRALKKPASALSARPSAMPTCRRAAW